MITSLNTSSAKIYQFAPRRREGSSARLGGGQVIALRPAPVPEIAYFVGASYHEAAIADEARSRKS